MQNSYKNFIKKRYLTNVYISLRKNVETHVLLHCLTSKHTDETENVTYKNSNEEIDAYFKYISHTFHNILFYHFSVKNIELF